MARRQIVIRVDTSEVQGEGAYLDYRALTWGERKELIQKFQDLEGEEFERFLGSVIFDHLAGWNWTDGDGLALPLPTALSDLDSYTVDEVKFLNNTAAKSIMGTLGKTEAERKN